MTMLQNTTATAIVQPQLSSGAEASNWRAFATDILAALAVPRPVSWAYALQANPKPATEAANNNASAASKPKDQPQPKARDFSEPESIDALLDMVELDATMGNMVVAEDPPDLSDWRPRVDGLLAILRLAKTFGSAEALFQAIGTTNSLVLLETGHSTLDRAVTKLIQHLSAEERFWPEDASGPQVLLASEAVRSNSGDSHRVFAALSDKAREAFVTGMPMVIVTSVASTVPVALRDLKLTTIPLVPLDREILAEMLALACPDGDHDANTLSGLPERAALARLTPDELTLALRPTDPAKAVNAISNLLALPDSGGPGLAEFPLPTTVRAPLTRMLSDLQAWKAGEIPWRDVSRGLLLVGPPGSGKTEIPRLIAREAGIEVLAASMGRWQASGSRSSDILREMRAFFEKAVSMAPCVVFIDELDAFGDRARPHDHNSTWTDYVVGGLLECLDGFEAHEGVVTMAATNHIDKVDAAIRRPGRFDQVLTLDYPTPDLMPQAIRWQVGADLPGEDLSGVAAAAVGMSGAAIAAVVRAARGRARSERRAMVLDDLMSEIIGREPPLSAELRWQVAIHEAGHAIVGKATGISRPHILAIHANGGLTRQTMAHHGSTRAELEARLAIDLAGRAAESLLLGQPSGGAGGSSESDLAHATIIATALEASFGLGQSLIWIGAPEDAVQILGKDPALRARVESHLRRAETRALHILTANRALVGEMARALEKAGVLMGDVLDTLVAKVAKETAGLRPASDMAPQSLSGRTDRLVSSEQCETPPPELTRITDDRPEPYAV